MLGMAGERDLRDGRVERAEQRAAEALRAADTVSRRSQAAIARVVLGRVALARRDLAAARRIVDGALSESEEHALSARARAELRQLRAELS